MVACINGPHYNVLEFIKACKAKDAVWVWPTARNGARDSFSLFPDSKILGLIVNDKLPDRKFDNTAPLEKGPPQDIGKPVDAYTFSIGPKYVYIAFYKNFKNKWIIKSFHPPQYGERVPELTHNPFLELEELKK